MLWEVTKDLKRTYVKVGDIARNRESGVLSFVRFLAVIDDKVWAIVQVDKDDRTYLVAANKLQAVWIHSKD